MNELEDAWAALDAANNRLHWTIFRPAYHRDRNEWTLWAFDPREHVPPGAKRTHERLARVSGDLGEVGVVREMAGALSRAGAR
jgi:hypothetical protein